MMPERATKRRSALRRGLAAVAGGVVAAHVRSAHAAGQLSVGFWDHWMPGANDALRAVCSEWAAKERVELTVDFISSENNRNLLTIATERQRQAGHDVLAFPGWEAADAIRQLEPLEDVMRALSSPLGSPEPWMLPLVRASGRFFALPAVVGNYAVTPCARLDLLQRHAGIDLKAMYPAEGAAAADAWTWESFLAAAEACAKAGVPFGLPLGATSNSVNWVGALFQAHGAKLVGDRDDIVVASDATAAVLDYARRLARALSPNMFSWDDNTATRWLSEGRAALIMAAPNAWARTSASAPAVAQSCWHVGAPAGPQGRVQGLQTHVWGVWSFSRNKSAAKSLLTALWQPATVERLVTAGKGFDLPVFAKQKRSTAAAMAAPPTGTLRHYADPQPQRTPSIAGAPASPRVATQICTQATMPRMVARVAAQSESIETCIAWAQRELQRFKSA